MAGEWKGGRTEFARLGYLIITPTFQYSNNPALPAARPREAHASRPAEGLEEIAEEGDTIFEIGYREILVLGVRLGDGARAHGY